MASYSFLWPAAGVTRSLYLKELYVAQDWQRQGIGKLLMDSLQTREVGRAGAPGKALLPSRAGRRLTDEITRDRSTSSNTNRGGYEAANTKRIETWEPTLRERLFRPAELGDELATVSLFVRPADRRLTM
jgi:GNAT superfamily N-acetyltransferase